MSANTEVKSIVYNLKCITFKNHFKKKFYFKQKTVTALWQPGRLGLQGVAKLSSQEKRLDSAQVPRCFLSTHHHPTTDKHEDAFAQREPGSGRGAVGKCSANPGHWPVVRLKEELI